MKYILKYNFYLSHWFAGKKQKDIYAKGTAFLFLNQVCFLLGAILLLVNHFIGRTIFTPWSFAIFIMFLCILIFYSFQKGIELQVIGYCFESDFEQFTSSKIYFNRFIGLIYFWLPFFLNFVIVFYYYS